MVESLIVAFIVATAFGFSAWRLPPRRRGPRLGAGSERAASPARGNAAGPYPACSGCPAGADCSKRR